MKIKWIISQKFIFLNTNNKRFKKKEQNIFEFFDLQDRQKAFNIFLKPEYKI